MIACALFLRLSLSGLLALATVHQTEIKKVSEKVLVVSKKRRCSLVGPLSMANCLFF